MNNKNLATIDSIHTLIIFLLLLSFSTTLRAQLQLYTVKNKTNSSIAYQVSDDYSGRELLEAKGYDKNKIYSQPANLDDKNIHSGYYAVVKCVRKVSNDEEKTSYGIGGSSIGYELAEKQAVKNLSTYDWGWIEKYGYEMVEKNTFDIASSKACVIATIFIKKDKAGNQLINKATLQYKTATDEDYKHYKFRVQKSGLGTDVEIVVSRLMANSGKVGVVKCIKQNGNIITENYKMIYAPDGSDYKIALTTDGTITQPNELDKYIMVIEMELVSETPSVLDKFIYDTKENLKKSIPKDGKSKNVGTGIRG